MNKDTIKQALEALQQAEAGLEFAIGKLPAPKTDFIPAERLALNIVRETLAALEAEQPASDAVQPQEQQHMAVFAAYSDCLANGSSMTPLEITDKLIAAANYKYAARPTTHSAAPVQPQEQPKLPAHMRRSIERAMEDAKRGMQLNDGKERVTLPGGTLAYLLRLADAAPVQPASKPEVAEMVRKLREHDDPRLYHEADALMSDAADMLEALTSCATSKEASEAAQPVANAQEQRIGAHVIAFAKRIGWPDDGEGAFEYIQRKSYAQGLEDGTPMSVADAPAQDPFNVFLKDCVVAGEDEPQYTVCFSVGVQSFRLDYTSNKEESDWMAKMLTKALGKIAALHPAPQPCRDDVLRNAEKAAKDWQRRYEGISIQYSNLRRMISDGVLVYANKVDFTVARNNALDEAARICESVNNSDNPMTAQDCADAISALRTQPAPSVPAQAVTLTDAEIATLRKGLRDWEVPENRYAAQYLLDTIERRLLAGIAKTGEAG